MGWAIINLDNSHYEVLMQESPKLNIKTYSIVTTTVVIRSCNIV